MFLNRIQTLGFIFAVEVSAAGIGEQMSVYEISTRWYHHNYKHLYESACESVRHHQVFQWKDVFSLKRTKSLIESNQGWLALLLLLSSNVPLLLSLFRALFNL
uniref:Secreted protein n=1 Tax=Glossina pallidipes TaxID=7398 RepID=A0A1B0AB56_GLOPL